MEKEIQEQFTDYSKTAYSLAIYPNRGEFQAAGLPTKGLFYVCLKLMGECGEFSEKIGKCIRDNSGVIDNERKAALLLELGDVLWYVNALCVEFGKKFAEQIDKSLKYPVMDLNNFMEKKWPKGGGASIERWLFICHTLGFNSSEIAKRVQLYDRSHPTYDPEEYNIFQCVHQIIAAIAISANLIGSDILWVANKNLEKLTSRKERGKLQGSGDDR